ncbi:hypothetical protein K8S19_08420 [bacterium]|nr:hypothetical protein [bacterium]
MMINLEKQLDMAKNTLLEILGENVIAVLVYGSAAVGDYLDKSSDINLLVVLKKIDLSVLDAVRRFVKKMGTAKMTAPLLMTPEHIQTSTDVFPIEFYEIKEKHRMIFGEDIFTGLAIDPKNLRHECEHELKGRIMRIRQRFLEIKDSVPALKQLFLSAHNANFPAFRTALRLKQVDPPVKKEEVTAALAEQFGLDRDCFKTISQMRLGTIKLDVPGLRTLLEKYMIEVQKLAAIVDQL